MLKAILTRNIAASCIIANLVVTANFNYQGFILNLSYDKLHIHVFYTVNAEI